MIKIKRKYTICSKLKNNYNIIQLQIPIYVRFNNFYRNYLKKLDYQDKCMIN